MAVLVDEPRRPRPLGLHLVPVPPQGRRAVHRAIGGHGAARGQHVKVQLRAVLVMAVHVDHGDGLVAAFAPIVDERLGAGRPLLFRALRRQLDDLCRQDALAGRAARDAGGPRGGRGRG